MAAGHVYTVLSSEKKSILSTGRYDDEGVEGFVYPARSDKPGFLPRPAGTVELYRLYWPGEGHHLYTTLVSEKDSAIASGWIYEWVECFVFPARRTDASGFLFPGDGQAPLYRLYHPSGDRFYTISASERDSAISAGYIFEFVECFVLSARSDAGGFNAPVDGTVNLYRLYLRPGPESKGFFASVGDFIEGIIETGMSLVGDVIDLFSPIVDPVLNVGATVVHWTFGVPIIGRVARGLFDTFSGIAALALSIPDWLLGLFGIRPQKYLKILIILQRDENNQLVADVPSVIPHIEFAVKTFQETAKVRILPLGEPGPSSNGFIHIWPSFNSSKTLDVGCTAEALLEDLLLAGGIFDAMIAEAGFGSAAERFGHLGPPIFVFSVRLYSGDEGTVGCSLGFWSDYVTVKFSQITPPAITPDNNTTMAHELGHACLLTHTDAPNLMQDKGPNPPDLTAWQVTKLRSSRHVTYFK